MKQIKCAVVVVGVAACVGNSAVRAENGIGFEVTADYFSKYIWRGQNLDDDPVFQPGFSASYKGFTGAVWGSLDTTNINDNSGEFTECDYMLDYSGDVPGTEGVGCSAGIINYHFPSVAGDTTEVYWGFELDVPLSPSVTVYHDIGEIKGTYISFGIEHSFERIAELATEIPVGLELGASLGWGSSSYNRDYWGPDTSKLNDLVLSVSFPAEIAGWTLIPSLSYMKLVSHEIRSGHDGEAFFAGIGLSKGF